MTEKPMWLELFFLKQFKSKFISIETQLYIYYQYRIFLDTAALFQIRLIEYASLMNQKD